MVKGRARGARRKLGMLPHSSLISTGSGGRRARHLPRAKVDGGRSQARL
jgi:hypothetical protein